MDRLNAWLSTDEEPQPVSTGVFQVIAELPTATEQRDLRRNLSSQGIYCRLRTVRPPLSQADREIKRRARTAVNNAIRDGKLVAPDRCDLCQEVDKLDAHH